MQEKLSIEEFKKCPYCFKDVNILATKCPYCQSVLHIEKPKGKQYTNKHLLIALAIMFAFFSLLAWKAERNISVSTPSTETPQPQAQQPQTSNTPPVYKKISLSEIESNPETFVEISGVVIKGANTLNDFYIHLQIGQSHALLNISKKHNVVGSIVQGVSIGNTILVKAYVGVKNAPPLCAIENTSKLKDVDALCKFLNMPPNTPWVIMLEDSKDNLQITKKSNSGVKAIQNIPPPQIDYSSFQKISSIDFVKNPPFYLNKNVQFSDVLVGSFLARGDRGGDTNYVSVLGANNPFSFEIIMLEISNDNDYQKIVSALNKLDSIRVYGVGQASQSFDTATGGKSLIPVIKILRLDCQICSSGVTTTIFKK